MQYSFHGLSVAAWIVGGSLLIAGVCAGAALAKSDDSFTSMPAPAAWTHSPRSGPVRGVPVRNFGVVSPGCLYRSAQPTDAGFQWLKEQGVHSVVCLRKEHDDAEHLKGLGMDYLYLPIPNEHAPTDEQAHQFLAFVRDPHHWPVLVHCADGIGRASTMAALARYSMDGWNMSDAMHEARYYRPFHFPMFGEQRRWLNGWQERFASGEPEPSKEVASEPAATSASAR